jgi:aerobic carbon-monoxide dehydrogenase medium subunit
VKPGLFRYVRADTVDSAVSLLKEFGDSASLLAGGQSLVPAMALRMALPEVLIDISAIAAMQTIEITGGVLRIGAGCSYTDVLWSRVVADAAPLLTQAIPFIAHEAIRNRGTFGGSLAHADPASELPACMLALEAEIVLRSERGVRKIPAQAFFLGTYDTAKTDDELLIGVEIPAKSRHCRQHFMEIARRSGDYAVSGGAFCLEIEADIVTAARLAFFAVSDRAVLAKSAAQALTGKPLTLDAISSASKIAAGEIEFFSDLYTGIAAKRQITNTLTRRLLSQCAGAEA